MFSLINTMNEASYIQTNKLIDYRFAFAGMAAIAVGLIVYFLTRPSETIYAFWSLGIHTTPLIKIPPALIYLTNSIPSFIHTFSFSCLSYSISETKNKRVIYGISTAWIAINFTAESLQLFKNTDQRICQDYNNAALNYFCHGSFDINDLIFSVLGGLAFIFFSRHQGGKNETSSK